MGWTSIKNYQYRPNSPLVNAQTGVPVRDGIDLVLSLYNRTGGATGSPNQVTQEPVAAAGNSLSTATLLTQDWNTVTATVANQGVQLPSFPPGGDITVYNESAVVVQVYPSDDDVQIDSLGNGQPYALAAGTKQTFQCWTPTQLRSGA